MRYKPRTHIMCLHPYPPWQRRTRLQKRIPPPITLVDKAETSSSKRVTNHLTLAAVRAPAKKVVPASPAPDVVPAPVFLDNYQVRAAAVTMMRAEPIHPPSILLENVGLQMSCQDRSWEEHKMCGDEVLKEDVVVCLHTVQLMCVC